MRSAHRSTFIAAALIFAAGAARAEAPRVSVDIAPVHSIAAAVMAGVGAPDLIVPPGASPHGYALRPSKASALEAADLVVWVGPDLTGWLEGALDALAGDAPRLTLEQAPGVALLPVRAGGPFEPEEHDDEEQVEGEDHAEHGEDAHDDPVGAANDPHLWLDPRNAAAIAGAMAAALSEADPGHAETYAANAVAFADDMTALEGEIAARLQPVHGRRYVVFHDAYRYFEDRFGLPAAGSVALNDAEPPRAQRVAEIRARFVSEDVVCVFAEPQFEPGLIATLIEGTSTRTATLDPLGAALAPGAGLYPALLRGMADDLAGCLGAP